MTKKIRINKTKETKQSLLVECYFAQANKACQALKRNKQQWQEELEERALWESIDIDIKD